MILLSPLKPFLPLRTNCSNVHQGISHSKDYIHHCIWNGDHLCRRAMLLGRLKWANLMISLIIQDPFSQILSPSSKQKKQHLEKVAQNQCNCVDQSTTWCWVKELGSVLFFSYEGNSINGSMCHYGNSKLTPSLQFVEFLSSIILQMQICTCNILLSLEIELWVNDNPQAHELWADAPALEERMRGGRTWHMLSLGSGTQEETEDAVLWAVELI